VVLINNEPLSLDDFLASRFFNVKDEKLKIYEAILGLLLRKYVPEGKKIELNLLKASVDTILDVRIDEQGNAKIRWENDAII
jgi:hypothetical protein